MKQLALFTLGFLFCALGVAQTIPDCMDHGKILAVNDQEIIDLKNTSANDFHSWGHIQGTLTKIYPDLTGHHHFQVTIGAHVTDTIEVIYNEGFGATPSLRVGQQVEACGDYITSNEANGGYSASPDGAILHWVHKSPNGHHDSGYLAIDGTLYGWN